MENSEANGKVLIAHPLHSFLFVDDAVEPTTLTVMLTSKRWESELEDDRRRRIAQEVKWELAERGYRVRAASKREQEAKIVEATSL